VNVLEYLLEALSKAWDAVKEFFKWIINWIFDALLNAIAYVIESIPSPDFVMNYSVGDLLPDSVLWFCGQAQIPLALTIILGGITFYFFRRILTLGIW